MQQKREQNLKRKQEKAEEKKKKKAKLSDAERAAAPENKRSLSDADKQMLERWESMRKKTKPFIHPIRRHMKELQDLKEATGQEDENAMPAGGPRVLTPAVQKFHVHHFVPQDKKGSITALKPIKVTTQVAVTPQVLSGPPGQPSITTGMLDP